jgi:hypothetical protein
MLLFKMELYIFNTPFDAFCNSLKKIFRYLFRKLIDLKHTLTLISYNLSYERRGKRKYEHKSTVLSFLVFHKIIRTDDTIIRNN